ncbi:ester cyclase [Deinococcus yavapaiensis]|uniref:Putative ester cyclase n=1 Tax=Deinococcus yavapaiensis KR-236 TaxID=694435 RepID=A0A318S2E3_9DEIO|nr:ester cyclase [Deinococcus yavapaiensis]PYE49916.1 putative ester cyclase [Deinococcus yavapaiensis KR-236]
MTSSNEAELNMRVARQFLDEVWTQGNYENLRALVAPRHVHHFTTFDVHGPEGVREFVRGFKEAFPDASFHVVDIFASADRVAVRASVQATHAETGKRVSYHVIDIFRFEDGRLVERWGELDTAHLTSQLQAPAPK